MSKKAARTILMIFSVCWLGWTFMMFMGGVLGDCFDDAYSKCWAAKEYAPALHFWRGLAIELLAIVIYLLHSRRRVS